MIPYAGKPARILKNDGTTIASFLREDDANVDWKTLRSFGEEWKKFNSFSEQEIEQLAGDYFDLVSPSMLNQKTVALDIGCGSGRWTKFVAHQVERVEAIEPSDAVLSAAEFLSSFPNVRLTQASVEHIPFADNTFDFVYSLGVLHHVPDTQSGVRRCYEKIKPGGWFLLYLYYNLDNRSWSYKMLFRVTDFIRMVVSRLPNRTKRVLCDLIALVVYFPLSRASLLLSLFSTVLADSIPLAYYRKTSLHVMRNDSLDRFGTPLEKRFSKVEIERMLTNVGFTSIRFSQKAPYWHAIAQKK